MEAWKTVLQALVGLAAFGLAWGVFSRLAVRSSTEQTTTLWAGAVFVVVIAGIVIISLLFSWLQQRTSKASSPAGKTSENIAEKMRRE